ncbi:MAG: efflux RND transporter periplasmic adaptor subunit [Thermodesulfobacteriota bacterium]
MRTISLLRLAALALVAALLVTWAPGVPSRHDCGHDHGGPGLAWAQGQKYTCSMHPFIIRDEPGLCPICGMELTPVRSGPPAGGQPAGPVPAGAIAIDPTTLQNMGVRFAPVTRADLARRLRTVGVVTYDESRRYAVNTKIDGWIERLYANQTGIPVKKGAPLLDLYSPALVAAQEELLLAVRNQRALAQSPYPEIAAGAERLVQAARDRLRYWDIAPEAIAALEAGGAVQRTVRLAAPADGVVVEKMANEGAFMAAGMEILQLANLDRVWIWADIYEYELPWARPGQEADIELPYPHAPLTARVDLIYPYVEAKTRTVKARLSLPNPGFELKPDMYVTVHLKGEPRHGVLMVPVEAVIRSGDRQTVFVNLGGGRFEPRQVKTGLQGDNDALEVLSGLAEGEEVVTSAQFLLDSESQLREAIQKMIGGPASAPAPPATSKKASDLEDLFK